jgi:hypothetical protein
MKLSITKTIVILVIVTLVLYFVSEYIQRPDEKNNNKKRKVTFNDNIEVLHFTKDPLYSEDEENVDTGPIPYDKSSSGESWEDAFKSSLLDEASKKLQQKILNSSARYANYATDHQMIMDHDAKIAAPFMRPKKRNKAESIGKTIREIYDSKTANVKAVPKKLKKKTANTWEYEDECQMNGGSLDRKGLTGHDSGSDLYGAVTYDDDFVL